MNPEYEQKVRSELEKAFDNWYDGWIYTHPGYWFLQNMVKPAMKVAYFVGAAQAAERALNILDEDSDKPN